MDWSREEVEAIVVDYLRMLSLELSGQNYSKAAHRRALQAKLNQRSDGSIEFKHGNVSAVMIECGYPYVRGYLPRANVQALLRTVVQEQLAGMRELDALALAVVQQPVVAPDLEDFSAIVTQAPQWRHAAREPARTYTPIAVKRDYLQREAQNQVLGAAGEEFVLRYEHWRLRQLGQLTLAERVEHVSRSRGDGLGYDILSFEADGRERFIEVKTTNFGKETPFFFSRGELQFSRDARDQFQLCRLFEFRNAPQLFSLTGPLGPVNAILGVQAELETVPIWAPGAVQTGCLHQERKGDWRRIKPVPCGLRPERAIAGVAASLARYLPCLRLTPWRWPFRTSQLQPPKIALASPRPALPAGPPGLARELL